MAHVKLSCDDTIKLIRHFKHHECLWNYRNVTYKCNDLKKKAWQRMAREFNYEVPDLKTKLKYLRTAYVAEKRRVDNSISNGSAEDEVHESSLFYFKEFSFLDSVIVSRTRFVNCDESSNIEYLEVEPLSSNENSQSLDAAPNRKRKIQIKMSESTDIFPAEEEQEGEELPKLNISRQSQRVNSSQDHKQKKITSSCEPETDKFSKAVDEIVKFAVTPSSISAKEDMYALFGQSIAAQLRNMPPVDASKGMARIQQTLSDQSVAVLNESFILP